MDAAAPHPILWRWTGSYDFDECDAVRLAIGQSSSDIHKRCWRYRIVIRDCPGGCAAQIDVEGPDTRRRLAATGMGTSERYELALHARGARDGDPSAAPIADDAILVSLEALPGNHLLLRFGALSSPLGTTQLVILRRPLARAP